MEIYNDTIHTEFKCQTVLKDNKHCKYLPIEPKDGDCYAYLPTILLDPILFSSNDQHHPQIFLEKCLYAVNKKVLLGKYIDRHVAYRTKCEYFFGIISFFKFSIDSFDIPNLSNFNSIFATSTISSYFS